MSEEDRYSRQSLIPGWDQSKLDKSTVILVGVGAIGSYVGTILASSGIKNLVLIDFDTIELSNLNRQLLFRDEDVGKSKAEVASKRLGELNPVINITYYHNKMQDVPISVYKQADVIVACLDTFIGRRWINSLAVKINKPLILGGMFAFLGDVQVIIPKKTACFECQPLVSDKELAQACTPFGEERKKEREEKEEEPPLPAVATLSSIVGGIMAQETLKLLLGLGKIIENYLFYDGLSNSVTILPLARREKDCPTCGDLYELEKVDFIVHRNNTIKELLIQLSIQFGLEKPDIMIRGRILPHEVKIEDSGLTTDSLVFVMDKNLAQPIKLVLKIEE
ncbi:MAG: ThiF family adenylyltransferase [Candidatus Heimdallarchaeaceae archaeon]